MKGVKKRLLQTDQNHPAIRAYCKAVREGMKLYDLYKKSKKKTMTTDMTTDK